MDSFRHRIVKRDLSITVEATCCRNGGFIMGMQEGPFPVDSPRDLIASVLRDMRRRWRHQYEGMRLRMEAKMKGHKSS